MSWREQAAPIIAETIQRVGRDDPKALRKALRESYPFGERKHYPYKAWCAEVQAQLGRGFMRRTQASNNTPQPDMFGGV